LELPPVASPSAEGAASPAFVRVEPMESADSVGGRIEVRLRRRRRVVVPSGFDRTLLIAVVQALEEA